MMQHLSSIKALRVATALSLVFWVSGLTCAFGCESFPMTGSSQSTEHGQSGSNVTQDKSASCAAHATHSCCSKHHASSQHAATSSENASSRGMQFDVLMAPGSSAAMQIAGGMAHECPLAINGTALATKLGTDESTIAIAFEPGASPQASVGQLAVPAAPLFYSNRGHTYLRCCVFLI
jgi:hypothetical protein